MTDKSAGVAPEDSVDLMTTREAVSGYPIATKKRNKLSPFFLERL
jgi:hypothetical protein